ncbi:MAG TPA: hypothetical protein ENG87_03965 [Candidatus Pacearchaeota archaeon]|nr:hypothetical protein [Candidatus Pacearchaeota archaeon]HDZ61187.1 hypothetical protein [Candidatus Pacearchaeota archaeon]
MNEEFILTEKKEFALKLFCFLVVLGLCIAIFINGQDLECSNCSIHFQAFQTKSVNPGQVVTQDFYVDILDIYNYFQNNESCLIIFDLDNGYIYSQNVSEIK